MTICIWFITYILWPCKLQNEQLNWQHISHTIRQVMQQLIESDCFVFRCVLHISYTVRANTKQWFCVSFVELIILMRLCVLRGRLTIRISHSFDNTSFVLPYTSIAYPTSLYCMRFGCAWRKDLCLSQVIII
jgi:hypothetical protein